MIDPTTKPEVYTHVEQSIGYIVLNRPEQRNAQTPAVLQRIVLAHGELIAEGVRAIVVCGEGSAFCSGFDMRLVHDDPGALNVLLQELSRVVRALRRSPVPIVVAAHGAAIAGGCALLGAGDVVVTDREAKLGYPVVRLGVSPAINAPTLRAAIGDGRARERSLDPALIGGEEAVRIGLAHVCVDIREDVIPRARRIALQLAEKPPHAMRATKRLLNELDGSDRDEWFERALRASVLIVGNDEQRARVAALWK